MVRVPTKEGQSSGEVAAEVMRVLEASNPGVVLKSTEFVGPQVGDELAATAAQRWRWSWSGS